MKKLIIFLLVFVSCYGAIGQAISNRSSQTITVQDSRWMAQFNMFAPRYLDTTNANLSLGIDSCGAMIFTYSDNSVWLRICSPKRWSLLGTGAVINDTIYTEIPIAVKTDSLGRRIIYFLKERGLISGGVLTLDSCMTLGLNATVFNVGYIQYTTAQISGVVVPPADVSFGRIDRIVVDTNLNLIDIPGMPSSTPVPPNYNTFSQFEIAQISVPANATCLPIGQEIIYDQNTGPPEWTVSSSGTITYSATNTDNPFHLTRAIYISSYTNGSSLIFTRGSVDTITLNDILKMFLYFNGAFLNQMSGTWYNGSTAVSNTISLNQFINPNDSNRYQNLSAILSAWNFSSTTINRFVITFGGDDTTGAKGLYVDYAQLQRGINNISQGDFVDSVFTRNDSLFQYKHGIEMFRGTTSGGGGSVTADNGLTINPANNVQWGGTLIQPVIITENLNPIRIIGGSFQIDNYFNVDSSSQDYRLGDLLGTANNTYLKIDDAISEFSLNGFSIPFLSMAYDRQLTLPQYASGSSAPGITKFVVNDTGRYKIAVIDSTNGQINQSYWPSGGGGGTVTNIATTSPISGGPITTTGTLSCPTCVVATVNPSAGVAHFAGSTQTTTSSLIVNADITNSTIDLTTKVTGALPIANGGTNNGSLNVTAGTVYYGDGTKLVGLAPGTTKQHLVGGTTPSWKDTTASTGGTVTSVSGTTNRITSTGGNTPVIDISAAYVGQTSLTTLGTVTTGTLSTGAIIGGVTMTLGSDAQGDIYYRNGSGVLTRLAPGTSAQHLVSGTTPAWKDTTAVISTTGTTGDLISFSATNTPSRISAVATGSLFASAGTGTLPAWSASPTLTTSLTTPLLIGGTGTTSSITFKTTTGVGTTNADIIFKVGNNGGTEPMRILNNGVIQIGGNVTFGSDNAYDIGGGSTNRVKNIFGLQFQANFISDVSNNIAYISTSTDATHGWTLVNRVSTKTPLSVQAAGSQSANLQEWQNSSGVALDAFSSSGSLGVGTASPTAILHVKAGTATANTAPLKFTSGINLTTPEVGAVEYDGTDLFFTPTGTIRKTLPTSTIGRSTAQTAAVASVVTETVGASDASYLVSANVLVTTATVHSFTATVTYTDEGNTSRTLTLQFSTLAGAFITAMTNAQGTVPYEGVPLHIRAKSGTTITIATTGTFTTVVYNVEAMIQLLK